MKLALVLVLVLWCGLAWAETNKIKDSLDNILATNLRSKDNPDDPEPGKIYLNL